MATVGKIFRVAVYLTLILVGLFPSPGVSAEETAKAYVLQVDGAIDPNHAKYVQRGLRKAQDSGAQFVILQIDTPGGLVSSMRAMVRHIRAAEIPVITYVAPQGARAASAGTFVTAAGHLSAMAPMTNIGAAKVVSGTGEDLPGDLKDKATNDAVALIRSIAEERDRTPEAIEALELTVLGADAYSAEQALSVGIIDLIADDLGVLLEELHGVVLVVKGEALTLDTNGVACEQTRKDCASVGLSMVERFLQIVSDPNIVAILLSIGSLGILLEFYNPGSLFPGIFGAIMLVVAFVALGNLPVNWAGVGLLLFAMVLLFLEMQAPGIGVFGIGGMVSFMLGIMFLFAPFAADPPSISMPRTTVSLWLVITLGVSFAGAVVGVVYLAWRGGKATEPASPSLRLVGKLGRVTLALDPIGTVQLAEEPWTAVEENESLVEAGAKVEVLRIEGLRLIVRKQPQLLPRRFDSEAGLDAQKDEG